MVKAKTAKIKKSTASKTAFVSKKVEKKVKQVVAKKTAVKKVVRKVAPELATKKAPTKPVVSVEKPKNTKKGKDTGSVETQIDNFTVKVKYLIKHLKKHGHDNDSRRGLLIMVGKRRRLLNYIKKSDLKRYTDITKKLKLKE